MSIRIRIRRIAATLILFSTIGSVNASAQTWESLAPILPSPEPFSLNSYDVIDAVLLLRRVRFLQHWDYVSAPETVVVRSAQSFRVGFDPDAYEAHQNRYSILLNDEPIDWDHLYVEYNGDMLNLRLLYTYRNQKPPPEIPYRLRWP